MSSILTNSSAMVALETLRGINKGMNQVQSEISTGKKVSNAKDSAAIYAISTVMSSDVSSFDKISDSLNLGIATVGVARAASEQVVDILTEMKGLIVAAQEDNVDRSKIQTDVTALKSQIDTIVGAAQFNGQNLVSGSGSINLLASLNREADGTVTASNINISRNNIETNDVITEVVADAGGITSDGDAGHITVGNETPAAGVVQALTFQAGEYHAGDFYEIILGGTTISYTAIEGDTRESVAAIMANKLDDTAGWGLLVDFPGGMVFANNTGGPSTVSAQTTRIAIEGVDAKAAGGLVALDILTVATQSGATSALGAIDALIDTAVDAAASFGSAQKRIDMQDTFVNSLMDSMKVGVGALVAADLQEASARLQSLQVQQQLGVQALSIANQAPQSLLSLFR